jgi:hypothetical protein
MNSANAHTADAATTAGVATTVVDGSITASKLATGSITTDKIPDGAVNSGALATGTLSTWQTLSGETALAEPNTKYLMPESGSGVLTLPANPPVGTTVQVSGQGAIRANSGQLIGGLWFSTSEDFNAEQILVSEDGKTIIGYQATPTSKIRIIRSTVAGWIEYNTPSDSGGFGTGIGITMSGDATKLFGSFRYSNSSNEALFFSQNSGQTWQQITLPAEFADLTAFWYVACSSDCTVLYAIGRSSSGVDRLIKSNTVYIYPAETRSL